MPSRFGPRFVEGASGGGMDGGERTGPDGGCGRGDQKMLQVNSTGMK
ncbi:hypothetical protein [Brachybacterium sacelli]